MSPILKGGLEIPITMVLKKHKASPAVFNKTKELMLEHYTEHGMFWHWNCDLAQDSGFVISVPQITFTDSAESYIEKKIKTRALHLQHCIAGV